MTEAQYFRLHDKIQDDFEEGFLTWLQAMNMLFALDAMFKAEGRS